MRIPTTYLVLFSTFWIQRSTFDIILVPYFVPRTSYLVLSTLYHFKPNKFRLNPLIYIDYSKNFRSTLGLQNNSIYFCSVNFDIAIFHALSPCCCLSGI